MTDEPTDFDPTDYYSDDGMEQPLPLEEDEDG